MRKRTDFSLKVASHDRVRVLYSTKTPFCEALIILPKDAYTVYTILKPYGSNFVRPQIKKIKKKKVTDFGDEVLLRTGRTNERR